MTYKFWWEQGAKRVVSARELSLNEIKGIRKNIPDEIGNRNIYTWSYVYIIFRKMSSQQLYGRQGCQQGRMYSSLQMEVCGS